MKSVQHVLSQSLNLLWSCFTLSLLRDLTLEISCMLLKLILYIIDCLALKQKVLRRIKRNVFSPMMFATVAFSDVLVSGDMV